MTRWRTSSAGLVEVCAFAEPYSMIDKPMQHRDMVRNIKTLYRVRKAGVCGGPDERPMPGAGRAVVRLRAFRCEAGSATVRPEKDRCVVW